MFGGFSPSLELVFDGEVHLQRNLEGEVPRMCTGISLYEFFILAPETRIKARFKALLKPQPSNRELSGGAVDQLVGNDPEYFSPEGFIDIRKL